MFALFLLSIIRTDHIGIDVGTQYFKIAQEVLNSEAKIIANDKGEISRSTAIAFKYNQSLPESVNDINFKRLYIKFGSTAQSIIKKNPKNGIRFLPHVIDRDGDPFRTMTIANSTDLFSIFLTNELSQFEIPTAGVLLAVPSYWTRYQRELIRYACTVANIQVQEIIDDFMALNCLYTSVKDSKIRNTGRHVVFIDVGATSIKGYGMDFNFETENDRYVVNETTTNWTEKSGSYFFAKALSEKRGISQSKAEKLLTRIENFDDCEEPAQYMREVIKNTIEMAQLTKPIDEIQLIGGASRIKFVRQILLEFSGHIPIRRDFIPNEAIAVGAALYAMMIDDAITFPPTYSIKQPTTNVYVKCRDTVQFCYKGHSCHHGPMVIHSDGCQTLVVQSDFRYIPEGVSEITQKATLKSRPYEGVKQAYGKLTMGSPGEYIDKLQWCVAADCENIPFQLDVELYQGLNTSKEWIKKYNDVKKNQEIMKKRAQGIEVLLDRLKTFFDRYNSVGVEATLDITQEMKETYEYYLKDFNAGVMEDYGKIQMNVAYEELNGLIKSLGLK
ncbi:hypothetical protein TRFO_34516 [Tritrichomonas foetus]|uniref:DnaK protein n=1 Tax=Tritrichomonas foetus TaxID=1144522 RepID=A0A1J4JPB3_9EUKA|nr:hypothetical protein TRFO_34516 [Tritrichomonas foetus]|eukprot:OHS99116.1 hypothetical protein TRFO_34516 [Tritrichomonas foetus]